MILPRALGVLYGAIESKMVGKEVVY